MRTAGSRWSTDSTAQLFGHAENDLIGRFLGEFVDLAGPNRRGARAGG